VRGFGGKCFPKDVVALIGFAKDRKIPFQLLGTVWKKNLKIRKIKDWEEIKGAVKNKRRRKRVGKKKSKK
jgi:UDP-glucose 6-dehydrogenase